MVRLVRFGATILTLTLTGAVVPSASAQERGKETILVRQSTDCSGTGTASTVYFPFSALFTGFEPGETGEVTAFTQPGGEQVGHRAVTVDEHGNRCELVEGTVPPRPVQIRVRLRVGYGEAEGHPGGRFSYQQRFAVCRRDAIGQRERLRRSLPVALRRADAYAVTLSEPTATRHTTVG